VLVNTNLVCVSEKRAAHPTDAFKTLKFANRQTHAQTGHTGEQLRATACDPPICVLCCIVLYCVVLCCVVLCCVVMLRDDEGPYRLNHRAGLQLAHSANQRCTANARN
jgi:hypothetical protein